MHKPKRYQECSSFIKIWRHRWYLLIPFEATRNYILGYIYSENTDLPSSFDFYWKLSVGEAQCNMHWYHTQEEMKEMIFEGRGLTKESINEEKIS